MRNIKLIIITTLVLLVGCQADTANLTRYEKNLAEDKPSAILIAKVDNADYIDIHKLTAPEQKTADDDIYTVNEYRIMQSMRTPLPLYSYKQSIYVIDPGTYYITYAFSYDNGILKQTDCENTNNPDKSYGTFTVKDGEVVYLGDLKVNWAENKNPSKIIEVKNNIREVKIDLVKAGYPEMARKVELAQINK